jgi:hypothetical protein
MRIFTYDIGMSSLLLLRVAFSKRGYNNQTQEGLFPNQNPVSIVKIDFGIIPSLHFG